MKREWLLSSRAACGLLLALTALLYNRASGQNLVRNPDFEQELGPDNWSIVYTGIVNPTTVAWPTTCGPKDFFIIGRSRLAHKDVNPGTMDGDPNYWNKFGLHFGAGHDWLMHAYASQVVSNLVPGASYTASAWITQYEGDQVGKVQLYMEVLGGPNRTVSKVTPFVTTIILDNPAGWNCYFVTNSASSNGEIEIQLHFNKNGATSGEKWRNMVGIFDHVCLVPTGQPPQQPPFSITSLSRTNDNIELSWESVMNNSYRLQVSTNIGDALAWSLVQWDPFFDPNLFATGPTYTFKTNVGSVLGYDPALASSSLLFFRVRGTSFQP